MPKRLQLVDAWAAIATAHDLVMCSGELADLGFSPGAVNRRVGGQHWRRLLPDTYLLSNGEPTRRQLLRAALVWAGNDSLIDSHDSCRFHGLHSVGWREQVVNVVVPLESGARSRDFVRVRRTVQTFEPIVTPLTRFLPAADAVMHAARDLGTTDRAVALFSDALLRNIVTIEALERAFCNAPERGRGGTRNALEIVAGGARSVPEGRIARMVRRNPIFGEVLLNPRLRLPTGRIVVPDLLIVSSGVVHETNGRQWHAREDRFESMQERHDALTASGLIVLHNSTRRINSATKTIHDELVQTHLLYAGRGIPAGIELLSR